MYDITFEHIQLNNVRTIQIKKVGSDTTLTQKKKVHILFKTKHHHIVTSWS